MDRISGNPVVSAIYTRMSLNNRLRSGGASAAANAGVPDQMFKRHDTWCSENPKDGYVKVSLIAGISEAWPGT
jgi:hypothetical protein